MFKVLARHKDLSTEKMVTITKDPECQFIKRLVKDYKKQGFDIRFEDIGNMDHSH